jgi:chemotaxis protein methyltransferase CheR
MLNFFRKKKKKEEQKSSQAKSQFTVTIEEYNNIEPVANYFYKETGITFQNQLSILKNKVISFCKKREIYSFEKLLQNLNTDDALKQELINYLTTNETYFYREFAQIQKLVELVKQHNSTVTIMCAPSATGEEPYSIAIALLEAGIAPKNIYILGIDINQEALQKAKKALYLERSLRTLPANLLAKYFSKINDTTYALKEHVKALVHFQQANIFDNSFQNLGKFDFIFSRNMLIYFDKETKQRAKKILESMRKNKDIDIFFGHADLF